MADERYRSPVLEELRSVIPPLSLPSTPSLEQYSERLGTALGGGGPNMSMENPEVLSELAYSLEEIAYQDPDLMSLPGEDMSGSPYRSLDEIEADLGMTLDVGGAVTPEQRSAPAAVTAQRRERESQKILADLGDPLPAYVRERRQAAAAEKEAQAERYGADVRLEYAAKAQAAEIAGVERARERRMQQEAIDLKKTEEMRQDSVTEAREKIQIAMDKVMSAEIDPNRIYTSTGQKMGAAIAVALGAAGAALTGTENTAMRILDSAIDRDIAAQRAEIDKLKFGVQVETNAYSMLMDSINDRRQVEEVMRQQAYAMFDQRIRQIEVKYQMDPSNSRLAALRATLKEQQAQSQGRLATDIYNAKNQRYMFDRQLDQQARISSAKGQSSGLGLSGTMETKLQGALAAKGMIAELKRMAKDVSGGPVGALMKMYPGYSKEQAYQEFQDGLARQIIRSYSGASARQEEVDAVVDRLSGYLDFESTRVEKLSLLDKEMDMNMRSIHDLLTGPQQALFKSKFGDMTGPMSRSEFMRALHGNLDQLAAARAQAGM